MPKPLLANKQCPTLAPPDIDRPLSDHYQIKPPTIPNGPSTSSQKTPLDLFRNPEWFRGYTLTPAEEKLYSVDDVVRIREGRRLGTQRMDPGPVEGPLRRELFALNDPLYNEVKMRKIKERDEKEEKQAYMRLIPPEIKSLPGHYGPSVTQTESEVIGQYLDLRPKFPALYPSYKLAPQPLQLFVRYVRSNFSNHPPIPNHSFVKEPLEGCYSRGTEGVLRTARHDADKATTSDKLATFRSNAKNHFPTVGERQKGFTWPLQSSTGLELNRPVKRDLPVVTCHPHASENTVKFEDKPKNCTQIYTYDTNVDGAFITPGEVHGDISRVCKQKKKLCAPHDPTIYKNKKCDPCHLDFINPQTLPRPAGF